MLQREQLVAMKADDLRKLLKENGISYYSHSKRMTKDAMIERYLEETKGSDSFDMSNMVGDKKDDPVKLFEEHLKEEEERKERRRKYVEGAKIGTIVAFSLPNGRVISAAIAKKSTKNRKFLVETKYGAELRISFDDVVWVKTGKKWPKGVYMLFKKDMKPEVASNG